MREVMRLIGKSLAPSVVMREMLHLMSELLGLNRGRIVLTDPGDPGDLSDSTARICYAYGLTQAEMERGVYRKGEGITGRVLSTGQPMLVQDIDAESLFLARCVPRDQLPQETVAFMALPIEVNHHTVGVLACHRIRSRLRHVNDDMALLKILATLAGQILQLQDLMQEKTRALETRNAQLIHALDAAAVRYGIMGTSPALLQALGELERVSRRPVQRFKVREATQASVARERIRGGEVDVYRPQVAPAPRPDWQPRPTLCCLSPRRRRDHAGGCRASAPRLEASAWPDDISISGRLVTGSRTKSRAPSPKPTMC